VVNQPLMCLSYTSHSAHEIPHERPTLIKIPCLPVKRTGTFDSLIPRFQDSRLHLVDSVSSTVRPSIYVWWDKLNVRKIFAFESQNRAEEARSIIGRGNLPLWMGGKYWSGTGRTTAGGRTVLEANWILDSQIPRFPQVIENKRGK
jgi:hypothetical protein